MDNANERGGRKTGIATVDLAELIDLDRGTLAARLSERLVGYGRLADLEYHVVGNVRDTLHLEVSGVEEPEPGDAPDEVIRRIAATVLGIETLEVRGSDRLDFHEVGVAAVRKALATAYEAGREAANEA